MFSDDLRTSDYLCELAERETEIVISAESEADKAVVAREGQRHQDSIRIMKTLLYVDDSPDDRYLLQRACRNGRVCFLLKTLAGGIEAIRYLRGESEFANRAEHPLPDLIFLDLKMFDMDGFQVLRWIRANPTTRAIPIVMFSGSFIMKDVINGYAEGANYFIPKPTDLESLVELVSAADKGLATDPINCEALARFATPPAPK